MTRFLTPSKIGLLALTELYTEATVPADATIPFLSFILNQLLPSTLRSQPPHVKSERKDLPFILDLKSFETFLAPYPSESSLSSKSSLWDVFLRKLWEIDSLDALHEFFNRQACLLAKTKEELKRDGELDGELGIPPPAQSMIIFSRTSPLGSFIRKARAEFERLRFCDATTLWSSFVRWRQESEQYYSRRFGPLGRWAADSVLAEGEGEWGMEATETLELVAYGGLGIDVQEGGNVSTDDIEKLLEFQVDQMQKAGSRIPLEIKDQFRSILDSSVMVPSLSHYLDFLDAWRSGDYPTSFDNLHRYFDYTMQNRDRLFYQYALMNMAVLQADFGCYHEAVAAMLETVSTARENQDMHCLNFALNWMYHFSKSHPDIIQHTESTNMLGVEREGLVFLRINAKECGMWTLWGSALLSEAKVGMANGESVATAFENLVKSSQLALEKNMKVMVGPQTSMYAALWQRLGIALLSREYCNVFLSCYARSALFDDVMRVTCRVAYLLTEQGRYDEAMAKLDGLDENSLRSWKAHQYWLKCRGILRLKRDLHRNNLDGADLLLFQLLQSNEADSDLWFEINVLHIDYLTRRADYSAALAKIEKLADGMKEDGNDINLRIKLLTMKALLQDKAGRPQKGFSVAVRAARIAWRAHLIAPLWGAMGAIANILTSLSEFQAASQILTSILPRVLECEHYSLNAQLYSFLVNACMGLAGQAKAGSSERTENMRKSVVFLDRAFNEYAALEDIKGQCEMIAKKANVLKRLGEQKLADECASKYLELRDQAALVQD